ncbi:MAG: VOC family protein [Pseudomonadota bacterium]
MSQFTPTNAVVWFEIPVSDLDKSASFYETVLNTKLTEMDMGGGVTKIFPTDNPNNPAGHLYQSDSSVRSDMVVHLAAPEPLEESMGRVMEAGGEVTGEITPLPVGRFVYCKDPDGNQIGLYTAN